MSDDDIIAARQAEIDLMQKQVSATDIQQDIQAFSLDKQETNLVKEQLSLGHELMIIENLLRGKVLKHDENGISRWHDPIDKDMIVLSEYGVHLIMNTILFYINKNTLLSNYDEETIDRKMEDFAIELSDTIFMEYEKVFMYPTFEECKEQLEKRIDKKKDLRMFANKLLDKEEPEEVIKKNIIKEMENRIDYEIEKISEQIMKNKLKRFSLLVRAIQDAVHSTYLRAYGGQERRTLRQRIHISEVSGGKEAAPVKQAKQSLFRR